MVAISICVPTYECAGYGVPYLIKLFESIEIQTFKNFEIVISDQSVSTDIEELCKFWSSKLPIRYFRTTEGRGSCEHNLNTAISHANGQYIKPLLQDDFFLSELALETMMGRIHPKTWIGVGCKHCKEDDYDNLYYPHNPGWDCTERMAMGNNLIGSPSVVMFPNGVGLEFDINLLYFMDCDFYFRLSKKIGIPHMVNDKLVCIRTRKESITNSMVTPQLVYEEQRYMTYKLRTGMTPPMKDYPLNEARLKTCRLLT
jgi:glycosyltransferase involved in cell wall biosynthesis